MDSELSFDDWFSIYDNLESRVIKGEFIKEDLYRDINNLLDTKIHCTKDELTSLNSYKANLGILKIFIESFDDMDELSIGTIYKELIIPEQELQRKKDKHLN